MDRLEVTLPRKTGSCGAGRSNATSGGPGWGRARLGELLRLWRDSADVQSRIGATILLGFLILALIGAVWQPDDTAISRDIDAAPSGAHWLGTDHLGRDVLLRMVAGSDNIIIVSFCAALATIIIGSTLGALIAYHRGLLDQITMRVIDVLLGFPTFLAALLVIAVLPSGYFSIFTVVVLVTIPSVTRVTRAVFLQIFTHDYIYAAILRGDGRLSLLIHEALPNAAGPLLVEFAIRWNFAVITIASLNFLGVGVQPPTADWGVMLYEAREGLSLAPWAALAPAVALASLAASINFTADGISRALARRGLGARSA
jgi:peptide/nickel transport system permease protein